MDKRSTTLNKIPPFFAIAACDPDGIIGQKGHLPWYYPEETAHFRKTTEGQIMIMGYETYRSLPSSLFSNRIAIVLTRSHTIDPKQATGVQNIEQLIQCCEAINPLQKMNNWVIGGAAVFALFFEQKLIKTALITHIHKRYEGDTFFPLASLQGWRRKVVKTNAAFTIARYSRPLFQDGSLVSGNFS